VYARTSNFCGMVGHLWHGFEEMSHASSSSSDGFLRQ
jgi:hypothetical protein